MNQGMQWWLWSACWLWGQACGKRTEDCSGWCMGTPESVCKQKGPWLQLPSHKLPEQGKTQTVISTWDFYAWQEKVGSGRFQGNGFLTQDIAGTHSTQWNSVFGVTQTNILTILLSSRVLMTVPKRRTSFWTSEEPAGVLGTFLITNRLLQPTGTGLSCRIQRRFAIYQLKTTILSKIHS